MDFDTDSSPLLQNSRNVVSYDHEMPISNTKQTSYQKDPSRDTGDEQHRFISLDFDRIINSYSIAATRRQNRRRKVGRTEKHRDSGVTNTVHTLNDERNASDKEHALRFVRYSGDSVARWILACLVGIFTGITAVIIVLGVEWLVTFRASRLNRQMQWASGHASEEEIHHWHNDFLGVDFMLREYGWSGVYAGYI
eukprot:7371515-Ditylum_brightwellii.AAC.1